MCISKEQLVTVEEQEGYYIKVSNPIQTWFLTIHPNDGLPILEIEVTFFQQFVCFGWKVLAIKKKCTTHDFLNIHKT